MIQKFVDRYMAKKDELESIFSKGHPENYEAIVRSVVAIIGDKEGCEMPDPERIHCIDDGDCQGTLVFVIGENGYQPHRYWYVRVYYGSCCGCDTLKAIETYYSDDDKPSKEQVKDYMTLALHIVQGLKQMDDEMC